MRTVIILLGLSLAVFGCGSSSTVKKPDTAHGVVRIANDSLEYEILIFEPGFEPWLATQPARGFYEQPYLENKNRSFVSEYNSRVLQSGFSNDLYPERINYDPRIDYGYEVNYLLYNYFMYFQEKYHQRFIGGRN